MAHTYTTLPPSLGVLIESIVGDCSVNLYDDLGLEIQYKADSFDKIMTELAELALSKPIRYPIFALIQPYKSSLGDFIGQDVECDLVICNLTEATYSWEDRETNNYTPILLPIYAEFMELLKLNSAVTYVGRQPLHKLIKLYHLGDKAGNRAGYMIPDIVDAVLIEGLRFRFEPQVNLCLAPPCEPYHEVALLDYISSFTIGSSPGNITVGISSAEFISLLPGLPVVYTLDMGNGNATTSIEVLTPLEIDLDFPLGTYIGSITSSYGSKVEFEYIVANNGTNNYISSVVYTPILSIDYNDLDCIDRSNYPIEVDYRALSTNYNLSKAAIVLTDGTVVFSEVYGTSIDETATYTGGRLTDLEETYDIQFTTRFNNILHNKIILQIKTI